MHPPGRSRTTPLLTVVVVVVLLTAVAGMVLTWPSARDPGTSGVVDSGVQHVTAKVTGTRAERCSSTIEDVLPDGTLPDQVDCLRVLATVVTGPLAGTDIEVWATASLTPAEVPAGTRIVVEHYPDSDGTGETWAWYDFARGIPLGALALAFALVTALVAGWRGLRAIVGLAVAAVVLWLYVLPGLVAGENAVLLALCGSAVIMTAVLYLTHGLSTRTTVALLGTLVGLLLVAGLGALGAHAAHLQGVTSEDSYRLAALLGPDGAAILRGVFLCGVVLAGLGVLNDVTITQASAVWELHAADSSAPWGRLFAQGMRIGRDHIASTVYTIVFAYLGASLPLVLLVSVSDRSLLDSLTSGEIAEEVARTLVGSIGLVLAIPFTTAVAATAVRSVAGRGVAVPPAEEPPEGSSAGAAGQADEPALDRLA